MIQMNGEHALYYADKSAVDDGRWVTIGEGDGGTHVFIKSGKITKGGGDLRGRSISSLDKNKDGDAAKRGEKLPSSRSIHSASAKITKPKTNDDEAPSELQRVKDKGFTINSITTEKINGKRVKTFEVGGEKISVSSHNSAGEAFNLGDIRRVAMAEFNKRHDSGNVKAVKATDTAKPEAVNSKPDDTNAAPLKTKEFTAKKLSDLKGKKAPKQALAVLSKSANQSNSQQPRQSKAQQAGQSMREKQAKRRKIRNFFKAMESRNPGFMDRVKSTFGREVKASGKALKSAQMFGAGPSVVNYADEREGRWITIGAQAVTVNGKTKKEGGTPVFITPGGKITKGAAGLKGKKLSELGKRKGKDKAKGDRKESGVGKGSSKPSTPEKKSKDKVDYTFEKPEYPSTKSEVKIFQGGKNTSITAKNKKEAKAIAEVIDGMGITFVGERNEDAEAAAELVSKRFRQEARLNRAVKKGDEFIEHDARGEIESIDRRLNYLKSSEARAKREKEYKEEGERRSKKDKEAKERRAREERIKRGDLTPKEALQRKRIKRSDEIYKKKSAIQKEIERRNDLLSGGPSYTRVENGLKLTSRPMRERADDSFSEKIKKAKDRLSWFKSLNLGPMDLKIPLDQTRDPSLKKNYSSPSTAYTEAFLTHYVDDESRNPNKGRWVTINGAHVYIKNGEITKGPPALIGRSQSSARIKDKKPSGGLHSSPRSPHRVDDPHRRAHLTDKARRSIGQLDRVGPDRSNGTAETNPTSKSRSKTFEEIANEIQKLKQRSKGIDMKMRRPGAVRELKRQSSGQHKAATPGIKSADWAKTKSGGYQRGDWSLGKSENGWNASKSGGRNAKLGKKATFKSANNAIAKSEAANVKKISKDLEKAKAQAGDNSAKVAKLKARIKKQLAKYEGAKKTNSDAKAAIKARKDKIAALSQKLANPKRAATFKKTAAALRRRREARA